MFNTLPPEDLLYSRDPRTEFVLDIRENAELSPTELPSNSHIPYSELADRINEIPSDKRILVICNDGKKSEMARNFIEGYARYPDVYAVSGGMEAIKEALVSSKRAG